MEHQHEFDKIIIGTSLSALIFSYYYKIPFIATDEARSSCVDFFDPRTNLSDFGLENTKTILKTADNRKKTIGLPKIVLWEQLFTLLTLSGLNLARDTGDEIFIEYGDTWKQKPHTLKIPVEGRTINYKFNKLIVFDHDDILKYCGRGKTYYYPCLRKIIDHFDFDCPVSFPNDVDFLDINDGKLVNRIYFHQWTGRDLRYTVPKLITTSGPYSEELIDTKIRSEDEARFKTIYFLDEFGVTPKSPFKTIRLRHTKRNVVKERMQKHDISKERACFVFKYDTPEQLISKSRITIDYKQYQKRLVRLFGTV